MAVIDRDGPGVWGRTLEARRRHAAGLAPAVRELLEAGGYRARDLGGIAVGLGPGSFTGLRVALALVKGLAYAVGCEVAGFGSLDVLAEGAPVEAARVRVAVEARRDAVYAADYERETRGSALLRRGDERIEANADWLASLRPGDLAIGPAVERRREEWAWPAGIERAASERCWPTVEGLVRVGRAAWAGGVRLDVAGVEPTYLSASAAEEKAAAAGARGA